MTIISDKRANARVVNTAVGVALLLIGVAAITIGTIWALEIPELERWSSSTRTIAPGFTILGGVGALTWGLIKTLSIR